MLDNNNYNSVSESCWLCGRKFLKPEPCICQIIDDLKSRIEELERLSHPRSTSEIKLGGMGSPKWQKSKNKKY